MIKSIVIFVVGVCIALFVSDYIKLRKMCYKDHASLKATYREVWGEENPKVLHDEALYSQIWKLEDRVDELDISQ